jgi:hypothetical protein
LKLVSNSLKILFFMQHHENSKRFPRMCRTGCNAALVSRGGGREGERERGV